MSPSFFLLELGNNDGVLCSHYNFYCLLLITNRSPENRVYFGAYKTDSICVYLPDTHASSSKHPCRAETLSRLSRKAAIAAYRSGIEA